MTLVKSQPRGTEQPKKRKKQTQAEVKAKPVVSSWEMSAQDALKVNFVDSEL